MIRNSTWNRVAPSMVALSVNSAGISRKKFNAGGPQPILKAYRVREQDLE